MRLHTQEGRDQLGVEVGAAFALDFRVSREKPPTFATVKSSSTGSFSFTFSAPTGQHVAIYSTSARVLVSARSKVKTAAPGVARVIALG
jgi:hypothetical protein